jgi:hypothetical protein
VTINITNNSLLAKILRHVVCPFGIIRGIFISGIALLFLYPFQSHIFTSSSRLEVFLFLAGVLDILSRSAGFIGGPYLRIKATGSRQESSTLYGKQLDHYFYLIMAGNLYSRFGSTVLPFISFSINNRSTD